jgi:integrase
MLAAIYARKIATYPGRYTLGKDAEANGSNGKMIGQRRSPTPTARAEALTVRRRARSCSRIYHATRAPWTREAMMARRSEGIYQRGRTWWLDFMHEGTHHQIRLGKGINRAAAGELASVKRAAIVKGAAGTGGPKRADLTLEKAAELFMTWADTACKHAKLADVTPHVLRHTFASRLAMAGVDTRTSQELGAWASLEMVERYTHLSPTHKAEAVERIAENSPALFTTPAGSRILASSKPAKSQDAPVAQADRAAVS